MQDARVAGAQIRRRGQAVGAADRKAGAALGSAWGRAGMEAGPERLSLGKHREGHEGGGRLGAGRPHCLRRISAHPPGWVSPGHAR